MISYFLTGLIVGVLLGLAIAPIVRSWIYWQEAKRWDDRDQLSPRDRTRVF